MLIWNVKVLKESLISGNLSTPVSDYVDLNKTLPSLCKHLKIRIFDRMSFDKHDLTCVSLCKADAFPYVI